MKRIKTIKQLQEEFDAVKSIVAEDTRFIAQAVMFAAEERGKERLVIMELVSAVSALVKVIERRWQAQDRKRRVRPLTAYQRYFGKAMKAGKTAAEAGAQWRARPKP